MMSGRARSWLLIASLAVNLFLVGLMAGHRFSPPPIPDSVPGTVFGDLRRMADVLPADTRREIRDLFESHRPEIFSGLRGIRSARDDIREILRTEPYDPEALNAAFAVLRQRTDQVQSIVHGALVDVAGRLGPDERLSIVRTPDRHGGRGRGGPSDRGEPPFGEPEPESPRQ